MEQNLLHVENSESVNSNNEYKQDKHVEKLGDVVEEEEMSIFIKFENQNDGYSLSNVSNYKLLGVDTDEPILMLGNKFFAGKWIHSPTTNMFFEEDVTNTPENCSAEFTTRLKYTDKTRKVLYMTRIFISPLSANVIGNVQQKPTALS